MYKSTVSELNLKTPVLGTFSFSRHKTLLVAALLVVGVLNATAQGNVTAKAQLDVRHIAVGDQARLFIEVTSDPAAARVQWPVVPDSFNSLEVVERGKIDTIKQGSLITYRQRLNITGFDSGMFRIPPFQFSVIPNAGTPYVVQSDSFDLLVQTMAVDTTKGFKGIKGIIYVKSTWQDYLLYILGGLIFVALLVFVIIYFLRNKKVAPPKPKGPVESLQDRTLRLLSELDTKALWQKKQVKEYYVQLTDIVRNYIEERFRTQALELTTDEILEKVQHNKELQPFYAELATILHTADLAKFAKAEPLPHEHTEAMEKARLFVDKSRPLPPAATDVQSNPSNITQPPIDKTI